MPLIKPSGVIVVSSNCWSSVLLIYFASYANVVP
jgi:hypothetical protein